MTHRATRPRAGFTLVEMLVVVLILAVLAGLTGAGIMNWIDSSRRGATETTIASVHKTLMQQMQAVRKKAETEPVPASVLSLAEGDHARARVIWTKLRLRQEFPVTYQEALQPHVGTPTLQIPAADLPPIRGYVRALSGKTPNARTESSVCLLLALQQDRGGTALSADSLGNAVTDTDGDGLKEIVDAWGTPLAFFRHPISDAELQGLNPAPAGSKEAKFADPLDRQGTLLVAAWHGGKTPNPNRVKVEALTHLISPNDGASAYYTIPVIASAGRDTRMGLAARTMQTISPGTDATDNIYSFRLRLGGVGAKGS
jgi:prepilin-type N-terminal cleavage/methylation domain-containing protein